MSVKEKIEALVASGDVVLFMKGTRTSPRCGFSAAVVDVLDDFLEEYVTVDVLSDEAVRDGIKAYSDWPTIPQLFVRGSFVGGADIIREMKASGELEALLGASERPFQTPEIVIADAALAALLRYWDGDGTPCVRLEIDREYQNALYFDAPREDDLVMQDPRFTLVMDRSTARRADGVVVDWVENERVSGFKIDNPNAPPSVKQISVSELAMLLEAGKPLVLFDVRTTMEREIARIEPSILLDAEGREHLDALDRDATVVFYCHHGIRSQTAAEHALRMGFRDVMNVAGGIEAWARDVDTDVPRY
jgi:monothiol glutaredoxin